VQHLTETQTAILKAISASVYDTLEELGLDTTRANFEVRGLYQAETSAPRIKNATLRGLAAYRRKLDLMGGIPKPASV